MPIQVACSCGKVFRVKNDRAGQKGRCPECGQKVVVPFPVLEADDQEHPVPWSTFPEEWAGEGSLADEASAPLDLGIDLNSAPSIPQPPPPQLPADDVPEAEDEDDSTVVEPGPSPETGLPPRVEPPARGPVYRPAPPSPAPAPPVRPQPLRVVLVGIELSFEVLFDLLFRATIAMLCVGALIGIVLGIVAIMFRAIFPGLR